jgi:hypothetical protein
LIRWGVGCGLFAAAEGLAWRPSRDEDLDASEGERQELADREQEDAPERQTANQTVATPVGARRGVRDRASQRAAAGDRSIDVGRS